MVTKPLFLSTQSTLCPLSNIWYRSSGHPKQVTQYQSLISCVTQSSDDPVPNQPMLVTILCFPAGYISRGGACCSEAVFHESQEDQHVIHSPATDSAEASTQQPTHALISAESTLSVSSVQSLLSAISAKSVLSETFASESEIFSSQAVNSAETETTTGLQ